MEEKIRKLCQQYNMQVDPSARVGELSVGEQQRVEILKALYCNARILVLDEPTAVLTPQETLVLFDTLREMARQGCAIVIITHKLTEIVEIALRVTVMRKGRIIGSVQEDDVNYAALSSMMMGAELKVQENYRAAPIGAEVLKVQQVSAWGITMSRRWTRSPFPFTRGRYWGLPAWPETGRRSWARCSAICGLPMKATYSWTVKRYWAKAPVTRKSAA
jgi:simple sugar transport system ATP-binding protein